MYDKKKPLAIASDHAGYPLKSFLKEVFEKKGILFSDFGTHSEASMDYPDVVHLLAEAMGEGKSDFGIVICGSGQGVNMTANKYPHIRAALVWDKEQAALTRLHNDANVLALPGRFIDFEVAVGILDVFLSTDFEGGRHQHRVDKIAPSRA